MKSVLEAVNRGVLINLAILVVQIDEREGSFAVAVGGELRDERPNQVVMKLKVLPGIPSVEEKICNCKWFLLLEVVDDRRAERNTC